MVFSRRSSSIIGFATFELHGGTYSIVLDLPEGDFGGSCKSVFIATQAKCLTKCTSQGLLVTGLLISPLSPILVRTLNLVSHFH